MIQDLTPFAEELEDVALQLATLEVDIESPEAIDQLSQHVLDEYARLDMASALFQMDGIQKTVQWFSGLLSNFKAELPEAVVELQQSGHLSTWLELAAIALREPEEPEHLAQLSQALQDEALPIPLPDEYLATILINIRTGSTQALNELEAETNTNPIPEPPSQPHALHWDADIHPELLDAYLQETPQQIEQTANLIQLIAQGKASTQQKQQAARLAHTIKGASAVVGVAPLASFTHKLEDILDLDIKAALEAGLDDTLSASSDCLHSLFDNLLAQQALPDSYHSILNELEQWHRRLVNGDIPPPITPHHEEQKAAVEPEPEPTVIQALVPEFVTLGDIQNPTEQSATETEQEAAYTPASYVNIPVDTIEKVLNLVGESITRTTQIESHLKHSHARLRQNQLQDTRIRQIFDELEDAIDQQVNLSQTHNRSSNKLDDLELEQYNTLHSTHGLLAESVADHREINKQLQNAVRSMTDLVTQQKVLQLQLSETITQTRTLPVQSLVSRVERTVRETCRATGKKAQVEIIGQELLVDSDTLQALTPPLLHMLRNAIDHGIETPTERKQKGKDSTGKLTLHFEQERAQIRMQLSDDGAGFNYERIRERAIEQGLITTEQQLSEEETLHLILQPGFSTREQVSETSGRGVGMDVVHHAVRSLRGQLHLSNHAPSGSLISIEVPLNLVSTQAVLVEANQHWFAIPTHSFIEQAHIPNDSIRLIQNQLIADYENQQHIVYSLTSLLGYKQNTLPEQGADYLKVHIEGEYFWLQVDSLQAEQDIVIKPLNPWQNLSQAASGATILADGSVAPILDLNRVIEFSHSEEQTLIAPEKESHQTTLLVVDDSLSNRTAVSQMVERMGYQVETARDGIDGLEMLNKQTFDLVITDLEMPRMNGLELAQAMQSWKRLPIIMLTSRSTQKHKQLATEAGIDAYLTKPVDYQTLSTHVSQLLNTE